MPNSRSKAFTVLELLLALALTVLLTGAISVMVGQAARDREAMRADTADPPWVVAVLETMERDLIQSRYWAASDHRLVLIGLGSSGNPAHIEYKWQHTDAGHAWVRHERSLTTDISPASNPDPQILACDISSVAVGPYRFDNPAEGHSITEDQHSETHPSEDGLLGVVVVVDGQQIPLQELPDQLDLRILIDFQEPTIVKRWVAIR